MKRSNIPAAIEMFKQDYGDIQLLDPQLIGFSWAIGTQGGNVILSRKYTWGFEFSLMTKKNYEHYTKENE